MPLNLAGTINQTVDEGGAIPKNRVIESLVLIIGGLTFFAGIMFGLVNAIRFRRHRTYSLGLFYVIATVCLLLRLSYCIYCLADEDM
jgi:hypothetical protein